MVSVNALQIVCECPANWFLLCLIHSTAQMTDTPGIVKKKNDLRLLTSHWSYLSRISLLQSLASLAERLIHFVLHLLIISRRLSATTGLCWYRWPTYNTNSCSLLSSPIPANFMKMYCQVRNDLQNVSAARSMTSLTWMTSLNAYALPVSNKHIFTKQTDLRVLDFLAKNHSFLLLENFV